MVIFSNKAEEHAIIALSLAYRSGAGSDLSWAGSDRPWLNPPAIQNTGTVSHDWGEGDC